MAGCSIANKEDASLRAGKGDRAGWREKDKCSFMIQCLYITPCKDGKTPRSGPLGIHGPSQFTKSDVPPSTPRYPHSAAALGLSSKSSSAASEPTLPIDADIRCG